MKNKSSQPTRLRDIKVSARDQLMISPKDIAIDKGHNPRNYNLPENRAHLDELKESIREVGVKIPLLVRWDVGSKSCVLVDGECRLRAVLELVKEGVEMLAVPTVQVPGDNEPELLITSLTANTGKPLSKWEIGAAFQRFIGWGWDVEKIARRMGYTERYVKESLELSDAPEDVKKLLSQQAVTPSLALQFIRNDPKTATEQLERAVERAKSKAKSKAEKKHGPEGEDPAATSDGSGEKKKRGRPPGKTPKPVTAKREKKKSADGRVSFSSEDVLTVKSGLSGIIDYVVKKVGDGSIVQGAKAALQIINTALEFE